MLIDSKEAKLFKMTKTKLLLLYLALHNKNTIIVQQQCNTSQCTRATIMIAVTSRRNIIRNATTSSAYQQTQLYQGVT